MKFYTGIGSRETPDNILGLMTRIAADLGVNGWRLRSGHADGADYAFERGAEGFEADIFLPWRRFNIDTHGFTSHGFFPDPQPEALPIAEQFHPAWAKCSMAARLMHARNVHQILGGDVTHPVLSHFVICWTKDGAGGGGTGQALRIARHYNVPIFDLAIASVRERLVKFTGA